MTVYFAQISDTHFGKTKAFDLGGNNAWHNSNRLIDILNNLPTRPDFVIHTGDVANEPDAACYALVREAFERLEMPIYYVSGNHDNSAELHKLPMGDRTDLWKETGKLDYTFEVQGEQFLVLDGCLDPEFAPRGGLNEAQFELLARTATPDGAPLTIFVHFPALTMDAPWFDANMLLFEGERFHKILLPARERLRAVFHGHVHQPMQTICDGIVYACAPSATIQMTAGPVNIDTYSIDADAPPGYNFVHLLPRQTIIHTHTFTA